MRAILLVLPILASSVTSAFAWGATGHAVVAELAQRRLTSSASNVVTTLLGSSISLASIASWADEFTFTPAGEATKRWHSLDLDLYSNDKSWKEECVTTDQGDCLPEALKREYAVLSDANAGRTARALALKFLVNLVGDMTQPLHCAERNGDDGGNGLTVDFVGNGPDGKPLLGNDGKPVHQIVSFRSLWDDVLINDHTFAYGTYVDELEATVLPIIVTQDNIVPSGTAGPQPNDIDAWVKDCHRQAARIYGELPGGQAPVPVDAKYQVFAQSVIDQQLTIAGVRLAALLNNALK